MQKSIQYDRYAFDAPPFRLLTKEENEKIIREINAAAPDFLWVGLGALKQEIWMVKHKNKILAVMIGIGAGFTKCSKNMR